MIYYFTGSGNSLYTARTIAKALGQEVTSILKYQNTKGEVKDKINGFVFPTYMGDIPWIVKECLLNMTFNKDSYYFLVMTSNGAGNKGSAISLDKTLNNSGAKLNAEFNLQMPGNCIISSKLTNSNRIKKTPELIANIVEDIKAKKVNFTSKNEKTPEDFVSSTHLIKKGANKIDDMLLNLEVTKACVGCGTCVLVCPNENIRIINGKAIHFNKCAACYACIHWCPKHATRLNIPGMGDRFQYHHPEVTLKDIINSRQK